MSDRIYCYPDSDVLKNKMGVRDSEQLSQLEKHLQAIHKYIFQDIYEWAGEIRKVDIAKGNMGRRFHTAVGILFFRNQCPASLLRRKRQKPA